MSNYVAVLQEEVDDEKAQTYSPDQERRRGGKLACVISIAALPFIVAIIVYLSRPHIFSQSYTTSSTTSGQWLVPCSNPSIRQEWRALSREDRSAYISAVQCLQTKPSKNGLNHTLWDDFPYIHIWYGHDNHDGASFFAYHRWFIHLYEMALRDDCDYKGSLPYWDWTLDWEDPYAAPVFEAETGFGGDGDPQQSGFRGHCIKDGPFTDHIMPFVEYWNQPHCLSRKFLTGDEIGVWSSMWHPDEIDAILSIDSLNELVDRVENGMHLALPHLIGGDFTTHGAPDDPIFFLHHAQLDRIYWMWQRRDVESRIRAFTGRETLEDTEDLAKMTDLMYYGHVGPVATVEETLDIQGGKLCYMYT